MPPNDCDSAEPNLRWAPTIETGRIVGTHDVLRAERPYELEALLADVDADHAIAERLRDLDAVVTEPSRGADDRDGPAGRDAVPAQLADRAERGEPAARERRFLVAHRVGDLHQRGCPHAELFGERAHEHLRLRAEAGAAAEAVLARTAPVRAARAAEPEDHAVADGHVPLGARSERLNDADAFVPEAH